MANEETPTYTEEVEVNGETYTVTTRPRRPAAGPPPTAKNLTNRVAASSLPLWEDGAA